MFWIFLLGIGIAITFIKLGAISVWVTVLAAGLKAALFVVAILTLAFVWKHVFRKS